MSKPLPRLVITTGEPAGIGPDVCLALAAQAQAADLVFIAEPRLIQQRANALGLSVKLDIVDAQCPIQPHHPGRLRIFPVDCPAPVTAGSLNVENAVYVIEMLNQATDLVYHGPFDALVTAPVHKGIINQAGFAFTGHTEWLAKRTHTDLPVMMLANQQLRVALATTHLPLSAVSQSITREKLEAVIRILHHALQHWFHIQKPRIRVCGLNPHAGESGHLGHEENEIITPLINSLNESGMTLEGPVPADTAFLPDSLDKVDAILAMYHDQGLPVLKYSDFEHAVNITLGLPIIRTSVDHGTALGLAGSAKANPASLLAAVEMAIHMIGSG